MSGVNYNLSDKKLITSATSVGTGISIFDEKLGNNLELKSMKPLSSKITIISPALSEEVQFDISTSNINLSDLGIKTLSNLDNVSTTTPNNREFLGFNSSTLTWEPKPPILKISNFANLPVAPTIGDCVFYNPLSSIVTWDGSNWVGPKITLAVFGRGGKGKISAWMKGVGGGKIFPTVTKTNGYLMPSNSDYKIYSISSSNLNSITGDLELHANVPAGVAIPSFASTGIIKTSFINSTTSQFENPAGILVSNGSLLQCFFNRTSGQWKELSSLLVCSQVAS